jgi:hypothetical protein
MLALKQLENIRGRKGGGGEEGNKVKDTYLKVANASSEDTIGGQLQ